MYCALRQKKLFQISRAVEAGAIVREELTAFLGGNLSLFHSTFHPRLKAPQQAFGVILHVFQHVGYRLAVDGLVNGICLVVHGDMHRIGIAEEVVHVAEDLLVGSHEEHTDVVVRHGARDEAADSPSADLG